MSPLEADSRRVCALEVGSSSCVKDARKPRCPSASAAGTLRARRPGARGARGAARGPASLSVRLRRARERVRRWSHERSRPRRHPPHRARAALIRGRGPYRPRGPGPPPRPRADRRRGWERLGHASLFSFLTRELGLSKGGAYLRLSAARLLQPFPEILEPLSDGRLCITAVVELAKVLTPGNRDEVIPRLHAPRGAAPCPGDRGRAHRRAPAEPGCIGSSWTVLRDRRRWPGGGGGVGPGRRGEARHRPRVDLSTPGPTDALPPVLHT